MENLTKDFSSIFKEDIFNGKVAFITGGGSGIGFTITEFLIRHGCCVIIASRNAERLASAAKLFNNLSPQSCLDIPMDVRKIESIHNAVDAAIKRFGKIDFLINGAAGNFICSLDSMSHNAFRTVIEIDTLGTFNVTKVVYEKIMKTRGGVILHISAALHYRGFPFMAHAGAAKAAIDALTKHMATEWGPLGIRVVGVTPGPISDTEGMRRLGGNQDTMIASKIPLRRMGTRQDIANAVVYLLSPAGSFVHGETLVVDGGEWMTSNFSFEAFAKL